MFLAAPAANHLWPRKINWPPMARHEFGLIKIFHLASSRRAPRFQAANWLPNLCSSSSARSPGRPAAEEKRDGRSLARLIGARRANNITQKLQVLNHQVLCLVTKFAWPQFGRLHARVCHDDLPSTASSWAAGASCRACCTWRAGERGLLMKTKRSFQSPPAPRTPLLLLSPGRLDKHGQFLAQIIHQLIFHHGRHSPLWKDDNVCRAEEARARALARSPRLVRLPVWREAN